MSIASIRVGGMHIAGGETYDIAPRRHCPFFDEVSGYIRPICLVKRGLGDAETVLVLCAAELAVAKTGIAHFACFT